MSPSSYPTRLESTLDLAQLPWFDVRGGNRLVLVDDTVGPIIDMHTHLAMGWLRRLRVELDRETPTTAYYLPLTAPVDLDIYTNKNLDPAALFTMKLDVSVLSLTGAGLRTTHTAPNLIRDLHDLGISHAVVLPLDLPIGYRNSDSVLEAGCRYAEILPFGSVHPFDRDIDAKLANEKARGALGIKLHPNGQFVAPDHPRTLEVCRRCGAHGLPVLFHCGPVGIEPEAARRRCQVARYERVIAACPNTTFILGHSGALQVEEAVAFADRYPNTYFELASQGLSGVRRVLEAVPSGRIMYGTDWPWYHQSLTIARVLIATEGDVPMRRAVFHDNAARLLGLRAGAASARPASRAGLAPERPTLSAS